MKKNLYLFFGKPLFDRTVALVGLCLLLPLFLFIAIAIKIYSPGSVFFKSPRIGKNLYKFNLYKFRTMTEHAVNTGPAVTRRGDHRITGIGRFLRKYKLDELPQLINVLQGDISIVGPRPEVNKYVQIFKSDYEQILKIKPGITDYAALAYRDEEKLLALYADVEQGYIETILPAKVLLYKKYMGEISFFVDLKIIFSTFFRILI